MYIYSVKVFYHLMLWLLGKIYIKYFRHKYECICNSYNCEKVVVLYFKILILFIFKLLMFSSYFLVTLKVAAQLVALPLHVLEGQDSNLATNMGLVHQDKCRAIKSTSY
jgi:hypothetical protein